MKFDGGQQVQAEPFWRLSLAVPERWVDDVSGLLMEQGAMGAFSELEQADAPSAAAKHMSMGPKDLPSWSRGLFGDATPILSHAPVTVTATFDGSLSLSQVQALAHEALGALKSTLDLDALSLKRCDGFLQNQRWQAHFKPMKMGRRLWLVPIWEKHWQAPTHSRVVFIQPGMAFGTGQHETTALCLKELEHLLVSCVPSQNKRARVLDVGCGSGVIALAASQLSGALAVGIDNDPIAVEAARENVIHNGLKERVDIRDTPLAHVKDRPFDIVVANILLEVLIELMPDLMRLTRHDGVLVLSGLLLGQVPYIQGAATRQARAQKRHIASIVVHQKCDWASMTLRLAA